MVQGESTKRSELDDQRLVKRLQERGLELLADEAEVWVMVDGSDLRKPQAQRMEGLMKVRPLKGPGLIAGYRTLNDRGESGQAGVVVSSLVQQLERRF